jgi:tetratricopeptide (TPR) repeat protein
MKRFIFQMIFVCCFLDGTCQVRLLEHPDLLEKIKSELNYTYSTDFAKARDVLKDLNTQIPGHPVMTFMEALLIFWENYPLTPENPESEKFLSLLEETTIQGKKILEKDPDSYEGLFFDLFGRALYAQFWADNGKPGKVFPYLNSLYRQTLRGMEIQESFNEFYFTSGLYNYYIEAYPEKHPAYKPVKVLFQPGDMQKGLLLLKNCSENAVYVKNEARYFLTHIYMCYESDPAKASEYAAGLYRDFPKNPFYTGKYAEILIYNNKMSVAEIVVNNLAKLPGDFAKMEYHLYKGLLEEKYRKNYTGAFTEYKLALKYAEKYGEVGTNYNALAWMGIGRYYQKRNQSSEASHYFGMAEDVSNYDYVLNDK